MKAIVTSRPVRADDEPFLKRLFDATETERLMLHLLPEAESRKLLQLQYQGHRMHYEALDCEKADTLLLVNDQPIGRMIVLQSSKEIRLADLAFLPEVRNHGLGTALIESLQAQSRISRRPLTTVVAKNNRAKNLYRRLGLYKIEETLTHLLLEWRHQ